MQFEAPGRTPVSVATPKVIHGFAGEIYQTRRINVNIVHKSCSDGMSDRTYPDTVQVTVDGTRYEGCGGAAAAEAPRSVVDGGWRVQTIAGRPVVAGTRVTIRFEHGRVSGNSGCNSFNGGFTLAALLPGAYKVRIQTWDAAGTAVEWWQDGATRGSATDVVIAAGGTATIDPVVGAGP